MFRRQRLAGGLLLVFFAYGIVFAQEQKPAARPRPADAPITVAAAGERVRFTAVGPVERMRLEVFDAAGAPVFDTGFLPGNVRDWKLTGAHAARLPDAIYLCVVTVRELTGRLTFKQGSVLVESGEASLALDGSGEPGAVEAEQALSGRSPAEPTAMTVVAHDGAAGQVTSTSGALTFRTGDVFSGREVENMRITAAGRVGIGTKEPQAALDVAGVIRARDGVRFADGSVLTSAGKDAGTTTDVSGTGTTGKLVKWTDGATGALGDSVVTESANKIGIATATPRARLDIQQSADSFVGGIHLRRAATSDTWAFVTGSDNSLYMGYATSASGADAAGDFTVYPLVLTPGNRVGIGTTAPTAKLDVQGDVNTSTQYSIGHSRVLSVAGSNNLFAGVEAGQASTGDYNSFFGAGAGKSNTTGSSNSFFGAGAGFSNATTHGNSFFGTQAGWTSKGGSNSFFGVFAGLDSTSGGENSFFGSQAGRGNTTGGRNSFFGLDAGITNTVGSRNTTIGAKADVGANDLVDATAIGAFALVSQSNSLVLGSIQGQNGASTTTKVGIGTSAPKTRLHVQGGNIFIGQPSSLIITSPDGACWKITVSNGGNLSAASITCP